MPFRVFTRFHRLLRTVRADAAKLFDSEESPAKHVAVSDTAFVFHPIALESNSLDAFPTFRNL